jgi:hypothetical protein
MGENDEKLEEILSRGEGLFVFDLCFFNVSITSFLF